TLSGRLVLGVESSGLRTTIDNLLSSGATRIVISLEHVNYVTVLGAVTCAAMYWILPVVTVGGVKLIFTPMWRNTAIGFAAGGVLMLVYSKFMKFWHRDKMMSMVNWRGDERVLDVGSIIPATFSTTK